MYSNKLIADILIYINNNINSKITIKDLEEKFFYNRFYIMKLFKQEIKMTIIDYITSLKIYHSITYIRDKNTNILKTALMNGFNSLEYFQEKFKDVTGLTPKTYKDFFHSNRLSFQKREIINRKIIDLYDISRIKDNYLARLEPKPKAKILSIFTK